MAASAVDLKVAFTVASGWFRVFLQLRRRSSTGV
jgi:hypothetical protein